MIAKCIVVLAIVAQINGNVCGSTCGSLVGSGGCGGQTGRSGEAAVVTRNIVARGKYPVALEHTGPCVDKRIPVSTTHVQAPVQVKPTVHLPCRIPAPRVVSHTCTCYKTVVRPRVHQQYITVPSIQRYIETTHKPVVENIHYEACPINCEETGYSGYGNGYSGYGGYGLGGCGGCGGCYGGCNTVVAPVVSTCAPVVSTCAPVATYTTGCVSNCC
ncbi:hypothetical protein RUM43_008963 [Polyplax serrata]|uniref:Uncharacterized protein n=1 Tax=Polyplax serrata TaxID=468196 RepID=A0AAN8NPE2_POLSC